MKLTVHRALDITNIFFVLKQGYNDSNENSLQAETQGCSQET